MNTQRQVHRIARLLGVESAELSALDDVPPEDLRRLHTLLADAVVAPSRPSYRRLAAMAGTLPATATAKLASRFMPASAGARITEEIDADYAVQMVARLPVDYLLDVSVAMDPHRCADVLLALPHERLAEIAAGLFERDELVVLGEFAGVLDDDAFRAVVEASDEVDVERLMPWLDPEDRARVRSSRSPRPNRE